MIAEDIEDGARGWGEVTQSLIEQSREAAVIVGGADATLDRVILRDIQLGSHNSGRGLEALASNLGPGRTKVTLRSSIVERCQELGVIIAGAEATIEGSVIRSIAQAPGDDGGYGISLQYAPNTEERSQGTIRWSVIEESHGVGVLVSAADATIEGTLVQNVQSEASGIDGLGICVQYSEELLLPSSATIRSSTVESCRETGIMVIGAQAHIEGVQVRDTASDGLGAFGDGIAVATHPYWPASVAVVDSQVTHNDRAGIASFGAEIQLGRTVVNCNSIDLDGERNNGSEFTFEDAGGNACGCADATWACRVLSSNLQAPDPVD
jgi:hypothetical protein